MRPFPACVRLSHVGIAPLRLPGEVVFPTFEFWIVLKSFDLRFYIFGVDFALQVVEVVKASCAFN